MDEATNQIMAKRKITDVIVESSRRSQPYPRTRSKSVGRTGRSQMDSRSNKIINANDCHEEKGALARSEQAVVPDQASLHENEKPVDLVDRILTNVGFDSKATVQAKSGWCLRRALNHIVTVDNGRLAPLVEQHGPPMYYACTNQGKSKCRHEEECSDEAAQQVKNPQTCFQSLCRIIAGQQLAGAAAQAVWQRLLETTEHKLTPERILDLVDVGYCNPNARGISTKTKKNHTNVSSLVVQDVSRLQKPAGLSRAKAHSIVHLADAFLKEDLTEDFLTSKRKSGDPILDVSANETVVRDALLRIKGIGPWSCDMFFMFYLEKPNILPLGDLGVRKGIAKHFFSMTGKAAKLCQTKDAPRIHKRLNPYHPYQSLVTYYMWRAADTPEFYHDNKKKFVKDMQPNIATPQRNSLKGNKKPPVVTP